MHSYTVRANATKLSRKDLHNQGKVDVYFFSWKNEPYGCCRQFVKLTNRIAASGKSKLSDSEGGRRPSERSWATINMFRVSVAMLSVLHATQGGTSVLLYFSVLLGTSPYFSVLLRTSWYFVILLGTSRYFFGRCGQYIADDSWIYYLHPWSGETPCHVWVNALRKSKTSILRFLRIQAYHQYKNQSFNVRMLKWISWKPVCLTNSRRFEFELMFLSQKNWLKNTIISFKLQAVTDTWEWYYSRTL